MTDGHLIIRRGTTWQDYVRAYKILVDGVEVGEVRRGGTLTLQVTEGQHTVQARISSTGSKKSLVSVPAGGEVLVTVSPSRSKGTTRIERAQSADDYLVLSVDAPS